MHKVSAYSFAETGVRAESGNKKENLGVEQIGDQALDALLSAATVAKLYSLNTVPTHSYSVLAYCRA